MEREERLKIERQALRALATSRLRMLDLSEVVSEILGVQEIESLEYHFQRHGEYIGASTPEDYLAHLIEHL